GDLIPTGIMASEKGLKWIDELIKYYDKKPFVRWNGRLNKTPNTLIISRIFGKKGGVILNNTYQVYYNKLHLFPKDFFCPKSYKTGEIELTENTYCIHHFAGSWTKNS
ncbi:MAG: glycosyl transferase, partial [Bacteroidales bacterium]